MKVSSIVCRVLWNTIKNRTRHCVSCVQPSSKHHALFSVEGRGQVEPGIAFATYKCVPSVVYYKTIRFNEMLRTTSSVSEHGCNKHDRQWISNSSLRNTQMDIICGYVKESDSFIFMSFEKALNDPNTKNKLCVICLEPLAGRHDDLQLIPTRVYGIKCFHDIHAHCHHQCKAANKVIAQCCSQFTPTKVACHMHVNSIIECKVCVNHACNLGYEWRDDNIITLPPSITPHDAYQYILKLYPTIVPFAPIPYNDTVASYDPKWRAMSSQGHKENRKRSRVVPVPIA